MPAHIDSTLAALAETWFFGAEFGPKYARTLQDALRNHNENAVDAALALGGYLVHSESNKRERHALRAVLLAQFVLKGQPLGIKDQLRAQYKGQSIEQMKQAFKNLVPAFNDGGNRAAWGPDRSTKAPGQSMASHVGEKNLRIGSLMTPDELVRLQGTNGQGSIERMAGTALTEHNEVIVCGVSGQQLPFGRTGALRVIGYFLQTRLDGTLPDRLLKSQGPSDLIHVAIADAARQNFLPLYYLPNQHLL